LVIYRKNFRIALFSPGPGSGTLRVRDPEVMKNR
jgi:hypothetical protein